MEQDKFPVIEDKRFAEVHYLNEWVTPWNASIRQQTKALTEYLSTKAEKALAVYDFVTRMIEYPMFLGSPIDTHFRIDWLQKIQYNLMDLWYFPAETLADLIGDCEDVSFLCTSMLRVFVEDTQVYAVLGVVEAENPDTEEWEQLGGHAWTEILVNGTWSLFENTFDEPTVLDRDKAYNGDYKLSDGRRFRYVPDCRVNDNRYEQVDDHGLFGSRYWTAKKLKLKIKKCFKQ